MCAMKQGNKPFGSGRGRRFWLTWLLALLGGMASFGACAQASVTIPVRTPAELRDGIVQSNLDRDVHYILELQNAIQLDELMDSGSALPPVFGTVTLARASHYPDTSNARLLGGGMSSDFRLVEVANGGTLLLRQVELIGFSSAANGGCIAVNQGGEIRLDFSIFRECRSGGDGGAIYADGAQVHAFAVEFYNNMAMRGGALAALGSQSAITANYFEGQSAVEGGAIFSDQSLSLRVSHFIQNQASSRGGALSLRGMAEVEETTFFENVADVAGCDLNVVLGGAGEQVTLRGNSLEGDGCLTQRIENPSGLMRQLHNTIYALPGARVLNSTAEVEFLGNLIVVGGSSSDRQASKSSTKTLCADFGSGAFQSLGANVATDDSCAFTHPNDLITSAPGLLAPDANGIRGLSPDSVAVDRGPFGLVFLPTASGVEAVLPCGYRDVRGLGRPQDGDGDGVFRCDSGAVEVQGGPDIGSAQTAAYYDTSRSGEGVFVDLIGGGLATVSVFTYGPNGGMAWFTGLGQVVGNSVVVDDLDLTSGGRFGAAFDADAITRQRVGGLSLVFPDCEAGERPGRLTFDPEPGHDFEPLAVQAQRLTRVVPCAGAPGPFAGLSGGWYAPDRSGEGVFLQFQPDGSVVVVLYSYTPQGELFWAIAGETAFDGTTLTASMLYPAGTTRFGSLFNASEVDLRPWGTLTMRFTGCGSADFSWSSVVPGYGSGDLAYVRLTQPSGTACPF